MSRALVALLCLFGAGRLFAASVEHGEYLAHAAGCIACHTAEDGEPLAGGHELATDFGTFVTPNITPDQQHGIGGWSLAEFTAALRDGRSPDGAHYYPSFPYTSYRGLRDGDIADIKAWLDSRPPIARDAGKHRLGFPWNQRWLMAGWKWLFLPEQSEPADDRGRYLVGTLGHCGECHTPRNLFGASDASRTLAGSKQGPDGESVPSLRPDLNGLHEWTVEDIAFSLKIGMKADGDFFSGSMAEVVEHGTSRLSDEDLQAIAEYLLRPRSAADD